MLNDISEMRHAIKGGRCKDADAAGKSLLNQHSDTTTDALPGVSSSADSVADWIQSKTGFDTRSIGRFFTGNRPDRNNNPGNLTGSGGFRVFSDAASGWDAMRNQLMRYFTGKTTGRHLQTISDIVSTWAPPGENNTPAYIAAVSKWMNVNPNAALNLNNPDTMANLMQSMARQEGYSQWNSPVARQVAGATLHQKTVINISGVSDPREAGKVVSDSQGNTNARMVQQLSKGPS